MEGQIGQQKKEEEMRERKRRENTATVGVCLVVEGLLIIGFSITVDRSSLN